MSSIVEILNENLKRQSNDHDKLEYVKSIKDKIDNVYTNLYHEEMTSNQRFKIVKDLKNLNSKVKKIKWSSRQAADELIKYMDHFKVIKFKYNTIYKMSLSKTIITFEKNKFMIHNLRSDNEAEEKLEIFDKDDDSEILQLHNYTCYYDVKLIKTTINNNGFKHVTVDDFILFLGKISNSEYKLNYSQINNMQEFE